MIEIKTSEGGAAITFTGIGTIHARDNEMEHDNKWYAKRIQDNLDDATPEMQRKMDEMTKGKPLDELHPTTLIMVLNMLVGCEVR